jgi:hypothetical protein
MCAAPAARGRHPNDIPGVHVLRRALVRAALTDPPPVAEVEALLTRYKLEALVADRHYKRQSPKRNAVSLLARLCCWSRGNGHPSIPVLAAVLGWVRVNHPGRVGECIATVRATIAGEAWGRPFSPRGAVALAVRLTEFSEFDLADFVARLTEVSDWGQRLNRKYPDIRRAMMKLHPRSLPYIRTCDLPTLDYHTPRQKASILLDNYKLVRVVAELLPLAPPTPQLYAVLPTGSAAVTRAVLRVAGQGHATGGQRTALRIYATRALGDLEHMSANAAAATGFRRRVGLHVWLAE